VTGVEATEIGQDFIRWTWEPVEGATGYQTAVLARDETHDWRNRDPDPVPSEANSGYVEEPSFRAEGLEPDKGWSLFVRAVRETGGGREVGPWSTVAHVDTLQPWGKTRTCTNERELARTFRNPVALVEEWDGMPFLFYFSELNLSERDRLEAEHTFNLVERLSQRLEEQLGYSILEVGGWIRDDRVQFTDAWCEWRSPGQLVGLVVPNASHPGFIDGGGWANPRCALWGSMRYLGVTPELGGQDSHVVHEIFHNFGYKHHPDSDRPSQSPNGIPMSFRLTTAKRTTGQRLAPLSLGVTFEDVDALRCIFPEGG
jgi:hypothetical protein